MFSIPYMPAAWEEHTPAVDRENDVNALVEPILAEVEERIAQLSGGDAHLVEVLRKRLITKLNGVDRHAAARRRSLNAQKFVAQGGRCAVCNGPLGGPSITRNGREMLAPEMPLVCTPCRRKR